MPDVFAGRRRRHHLFFTAAAAAIALGLAAPVRAQPAVEVNIPDGPLSKALLTLATQAHQELFYPAELVAGRRAHHLEGQFTIDEALQRLLAGAGIVATRVSPQVIVLKPAAPSREAAEAVPTGTPDRPFAGGEPAPLTTARASDPGHPVEPATAVTTVEGLVVTGTNIHGVTTTPSPIVTLDRAQLDRSGYATVAGALAVLPQNFAGTATEATATTGVDRNGTNATYASGVNLRGLGSDATLVLVNGRRMAGAGDKGDFADVSTIPTAAVDHIDVLLDGASALYGSDAVGGVVNIILRKDYEGAETRASIGRATQGQPYETQFAQTVGHRWASGSALISYEFDERSALAGGDRRFSADSDLRPLGGTNHDSYFAFPGNILRSNQPTWAIPAGQTGVGLTPGQFQAGAVNLQNTRLGADLLPQQTRHSLYLSGRQELGERVEVSADLRLGVREFAARLAPSSAVLYVDRTNPFFVSPNRSGYDLIAYSFANQLPPAETSGTARSLGFSAGATVRLGGDWQANGYLAFAQETGRTLSTGLLNSDALDETLGGISDDPATTYSPTRDGYFNPFSGTPGANGPALLAFIGEGYYRSFDRDKLTSVNLQADGSLLHLPAGAVKLAVGGQVRQESFFRSSLDFTSHATPTAGLTADDKRTVEAAFAELRVPLFGPANARPGLQRLEVSLAGRLEHYADFGTPSTPKVGVLWSPLQDVTVRSTYGRSFRAPSLRELHDPEQDTPSLLPLNGGRVLSVLRYGGNPDLRPERATSWTAGVDYTPTGLRGLKLSATWFDTRFDQRIGTPTAQNILTVLSDPTLAGFVTRVAPATNAQDLALVSALVNSPAFYTGQGVFPASSYGAIVDVRYVNTASLEVRGVDLSASYAFDLGADSFALSANGSYITHYDQRVTPTAAVVNEAGIANFPVKFRGRIAGDWTHGPFGATAAFNYVSAYHDRLGARIGDQPTVDLQGRWRAPDRGLLSGLELTLSIRNLFDRDPPFYDSAAGVGFDPANADPIGRFASLQLTKRW